MLSLGRIHGFNDVVRQVELKESPLVLVENQSDEQFNALKDCNLKNGDNYFIDIDENQIIMKVSVKEGDFYCRFICPGKINDILEFHKYGVRLVAAISNFDEKNRVVIADIYAFFHHLDSGNCVVVTEDSVLKTVRSRFKANAKATEDMFDLPVNYVAKSSEQEIAATSGSDANNPKSEPVSNGRPAAESEGGQPDDYGYFFSFNHNENEDVNSDNQEFGVFGGRALNSGLLSGDADPRTSAKPWMDEHLRSGSTTSDIPVEQFTQADQENNFGSNFTVLISGKSYFVYSLPYDADFEYVDKYAEREKRKSEKKEFNRVLKKQKEKEKAELSSYKGESTSLFPDKHSPDKDESDYSEDVQEDAEDIDDLYEIPSFMLERMQPQKELKTLISATHRAFTAVGEDLRIPMFFKAYDENTELLTTKTAVFAVRDSVPRFGIASGLLFFVSHDKFVRYQQRLALQKSSSVLRRMMDNKESYLGKWEVYSRYEFRNEISRWCRFGLIRITTVTQTPGGCRLFLSQGFLNVRHLMRSGDEIMIVSNNAATGLISLGDEFSKAGKTNVVIKNTESRDIALEVLDYECDEMHYLCKKIYPEKSKVRNTFIIKSIDGVVIDVTSGEDSNLPSNGDYLTLSSSGTAKAYKRRTEVLEKIKNEDSEMPHLKLLIEDSADLDLQLNHITRNNNRRILAPLSKRVKDKIFSRNPPTETQIEAINIALNTPDIALIQGPPGTGKTTVITAIIERLNEEFAKNDIKGQILVSGFQHDAVENIIQRLSINSLPSLKFGSKRGIKSYSSNQTFHRIEHWAENTAKKLRQKHEDVRATEEELLFDELIMEYSISPSAENEDKILAWIINSGNSAVLQSKERVEAQFLRQELKFQEAAENMSLQNAVNRLRTKKTSFSDDGVDSCLALMAMKESRGVLDDKDLEILSEAVSVTEQSLDEYLKKLEALKIRLLNRLLPPPEFHSPKPKKQITKLISKIKRLIKQSHRDPKNLESSIVLDFISDLESNPYSVRKTIEEYQLVYAATTQQSLGDDIKNAKISRDQNLEGLQNDIFPSYDTVIIDEAARANPSDLLIPMSQARSRIILVGDHRQLPHMVEEDILQAINNEQQIDGELYKKSMFEYLFYRLQNLTAIDGIRRTITLDSQYRTHPFLGNFVSTYFYKIHDQSEAFDSPLPEGMFQQQLRGIAGKCCTWFNVPYRKGGTEKTSSGSSFRSKEAVVCANLIQHWIDSEEGKELTFGIITFYSAQREEILKELAGVGIARQLEDKTFDIADQYKYLPNGKERLRVGSVDAFQGMEFDIVLLSVVRTEDYKELDRLSATEATEIAKRKAVGFLAVENRLCVSMSRQKRFLGIVGDGEFFNHPLCAQAIPSLSALFKCCSRQMHNTSMISI